MLLSYASALLVRFAYMGKTAGAGLYSPQLSYIVFLNQAKTLMMEQIKPNHIAGVQIAFIDAGSKEGPDFILSHIQVEYSDGINIVRNDLAASPKDVQDLLSRICVTLNAKNG